LQDFALEINGRTAFSVLSNQSAVPLGGGTTTNGTMSGYMNTQEIHQSHSSSFVKPSLKSSLSSYSMTSETSPIRRSISATSDVLVNAENDQNQFSSPKKGLYNNPIGLYSAETLNEMAGMHKLSLKGRDSESFLLRGYVIHFLLTVNILNAFHMYICLPQFITFHDINVELGQCT
ncbi:LOW QUALITY PROTEIN: uncharacterized protein ACMZJ9_015029, partial [Mantella aurantiaca]